jgi:hypothetical protein
MFNDKEFLNNVKSFNKKEIEKVIKDEQNITNITVLLKCLFHYSFSGAKIHYPEQLKNMIDSNIKIISSMIYISKNCKGFENYLRLKRNHLNNNMLNYMKFYKLDRDLGCEYFKEYLMSI